MLETLNDAFKNDLLLDVLSPKDNYPEDDPPTHACDAFMVCSAVCYGGNVASE